MDLNKYSLRKLPSSKNQALKQFQNQTIQNIKRRLIRNKSDAFIPNKINTVSFQQEQLHSKNIPQSIQPTELAILSQKRSSLSFQNEKQAYQLNNNFQRQYSDHINLIVSKNPEYFEHLSGKCKCFETNFLKRCGGMDQNQYKQSSKISSTYGNDYARTKSNIDPKAAQLKSDPHESSFYDFGTKKYFMNSQTIASVDFNNFPKTKLVCNRIKKKQIEATVKTKEPMLYTRSHYDSEYQGLVCPPVIPYHKLIHQNDNYLESKNPFKFTSKSIYGTSYYNWSDRFIPNPVYDKTKLLGIFNSMPFQARSTTKNAYSLERAKIRETEKPIKYEQAPQSLPSFKRQFISTANGDYGRIKLFNQNINQNKNIPEQKGHIIDQIKLQLSNIQNPAGDTFAVYQ